MKLTKEQAIKALELEPCEDAISRQAVLEYIERNEADLWHRSENELVRQDIKALPPVTPQPKMGRWVEERNDYGEITHWHCSNCYEDSGFITTCKWDYCPKCGAKM